MASVMTGTATVVIDGGGPYECEVEITHEVEMIRSDRATKPDARWEHTDSNGHFHAYAVSGKLPTLRTEYRHIDCDGSCEPPCEGYDVPYYLCVICGEEVEPAWVADVEAQTIGVPIEGPKRATVTLLSNRPFEDRATVSLRVSAGGQEMIGIGTVFNAGAEWRSGEPPVHTVEIQARFLEPRLH